ncbi:MAG TPA: hypothetical protein VFX21_11320 [Acidimicrobiia bacterium]|jgi:hypothetical protein|nr:hypothetical protein [Acidimicrobiia bacterium]
MKLSGIIAICTTSAVLATAGVSVAGAASSTGTTEPTAATANAHRPAARRAIAGALKVAADAIGITRAQLATELKAGKSVAEVATAHDKTPQSIVDALVAAGTKRINAAKDAGKITDEQAQTALEKLPARAEQAVNAKAGDRKARKHHARVRRLAGGALRRAADVIGIEPKALIAELRSGKTIAEVATAKGKAPQAVIDAIVAAGSERINTAHDNHKLTDEQAAALLDKLPGRAEKFVNEWTPKSGK